MTCICLIPPPPASPPFSQCVLISNVCGFCWWFYEKDNGKKKETGEDSMVCRDGWWLVWLVITIASFWHEYVCKDTNVHCGRWEHFKIEKLKKKKGCWPYQHIMKSVFFVHSFARVCVGLAQWHLFGCCTHSCYWITNWLPLAQKSQLTLNSAASPICLGLFGFGRQWLSTQQSVRGQHMHTVSLASPLIYCGGVL